MEVATAMDFHTLSRRELQALCKRNGIRANMTNVAMAEALQGLTTVDGIDEIGTTLCLPTPGKSAMKSAAKTVPVEEQQHGSPLPRGRRVSVKSPEAIRMEVEGGEDEMKEIVKTPGVAPRSTRRGTRATPAPLPTPVPACSTRATARRTAAARKTGDVVPTPATRMSQRTASRKAAGAVEADRPAEDVPEEKTSKMTIALDQEAEVASASKEEKVQQDEPKAVVSDVKCDGPKEEEEGQQDQPKAVAADFKCDDPEAVEVTKLLEGDNKEEELEEGEEADSSDATTGYATVLVKSCNDSKVEEEVVVVMEEQSTKPHEGIVKEQEPISVVGSAPLTVMDDSPIRGDIEKEQDALVEDCEDLAEFSPAREITDEIIPVTEDKEVAISEEEDCEDLAEFSPAREITDEIIPVTEDKEVAISEEALTEDKEVVINEEAIEEDSFANTVETDPTPKEIFAAGGDETIGEGEVILTEVKKGADDEMTQVADKVPQDEVAYNETSEEDEDDSEDDSETSEEDEDDSEEREGADAKMLQGELAENETSGEDDLDEDEEWASDDDENTEEIGSTDENEEDTDEANEQSYTIGEGEVILTEVKKGADDEMTQAADKVPQDEVAYNETSEEDEDDSEDDSETSEEDEDDSEEREGADAKMLQGELAENETSGEDDLDEDEEWASDDDENTEEIGSTDENEEDTDEANEQSYTTGAVQMLQGTVIAEEAKEDAFNEDDDFSGDLPPEFDSIMICSDAETESGIAAAGLEENQAAVASATKTAKSLDDSAMNAEQEEGPEEADATQKALKEVDNIVKSLDEFTFKDGGSEEMQKQQPQDYNSMSLRKLRTTYKKCLIATKQEGKQEEVTEGKRLPLEEVDENACCNK